MSQRESKPVDAGVGSSTSWLTAVPGWVNFDESATTIRDEKRDECGTSWSYCVLRCFHALESSGEGLAALLRALFLKAPWARIASPQGKDATSSAGGKKPCQRLMNG